MKYTIQAACGCHRGKIRKNNEDNFYFDGNCLVIDNNGLIRPIVIEGKLNNERCFAVFDGMGGENFGEHASYAAARQLQLRKRRIIDFLISKEKYLQSQIEQLNLAVTHAQTEMLTEKMGTTMVSLYFTGRYVYIANIGDSRAYRLRNNEFMQISVDHVEKYSDREKKAPLTQYLGINPEEMHIEPHIAKCELQKDDRYLLCSDGLTDMLTDYEISAIMQQNEDVEACTQQLIQSALLHGGRDNITVILCRVTQKGN